jgi:hypothetical protein
MREAVGRVGGGTARELFYVSADGFMMSVGISMTGASVDVGQHRKLFRIDSPGITDEAYDVTTDGQRFLVITRANTSNMALTLMVNWPAMLARPD